MSEHRRIKRLTLLFDGVRKQLHDWNMESVCQYFDSVQRRIAKPPLNAAHVGTSVAARVGEGLLRVPSLLAQLADAHPEFHSQRLFGHAENLHVCALIGHALIVDALIVT